MAMSDASDASDAFVCLCILHRPIFYGVNYDGKIAFVFDLGDVHVTRTNQHVQIRDAGGGGKQTHHVDVYCSSQGARRTKGMRDDLL